MQYPKHLIQLIEALKKLPGVGSRTAERYAFHMLDWDVSHLKDLAHLTATFHDHLTSCPKCGCLTDSGECHICNDPRRDTNIICVLGFTKDVYAIEQTGEYRGLYHVLQGLLSPMEGRCAEDLGIPALIERIILLEVSEVVFAFDSTVEGDTTALHIKRELEGRPVKVSRLAFGVPMGSALEYVDEGTLALAFSGRRSL